MAVKLATPKMAFMQKVLSQKAPEAWDKVVMLDSAGVAFSIEILSIKAVLPGGKAYPLLLATHTTTMMNQPDAPEVCMARDQLVNFIHVLHSKVFPEGVPVSAPNFPVNPSMGIVTGYDFSQVTVNDDTYPGVPAGSLKAAPYAGQTTTEYLQSIATTKIPKIKPGVIRLRDAEALGQAVNGSSASSVYRVVAANSTVKVACRVAGDGISLRIEGKNMSDADLSRIKQAGMPWHGNKDAYGSLHLQDKGDIPSSAILGSFLYKLAIKFDQVLQPGEAIPS